jgi:predicted hotdog family 3-hydroxylacyl-ACP dehydratase
MNAHDLPQPEEVLPHRPPMILIDSIDEIGPDYMLSHVRIDETSLFYEHGKGVPVWVGIEYMAQTVAAFVGADSRRNGEPIKMGFLLGTRRLNTDTTFFVLGQKLQIQITRLLQESELGQFQCRILNEAGEELAAGNISTYMPDDCHAFLESQGL